jgi:hypothetical protein
VENIEKAFNILKDIIIDERITCKVTKPNCGFYTDDIQHGKQITIYCCANPEKEWENIFKHIEEALLEGNIEGDISAKGDKQIEGSLYISYRNDNRGDDTYIDSEEAGFNYNHGNFPDPFLQFDISPPEIRFHVRQ